jgi:hypothetical protein
LLARRPVLLWRRGVGEEGELHVHLAAVLVLAILGLKGPPVVHLALDQGVVKVDSDLADELWLLDVVGPDSNLHDLAALLRPWLARLGRHALRRHDTRLARQGLGRCRGQHVVYILVDGEAQLLVPLRMLSAALDGLRSTLNTADLHGAERVLLAESTLVGQVFSGADHNDEGAEDLGLHDGGRLRRGRGRGAAMCWRICRGVLVDTDVCVERAGEIKSCRLEANVGVGSAGAVLSGATR